MCGIETAEKTKPMKFITALLQGKCPKCHKGDLFQFPIQKLRSFDVMNRSCAHCSVTFEPEPGFYQGAMFVGYALSVACIAIVSAILFILGNPSVLVYILTVVGCTIAIAPMNYRYSRIIYLYLFGGIKHDSHLSQ